MCAYSNTNTEIVRDASFRDVGKHATFVGRKNNGFVMLWCLISLECVPSTGAYNGCQACESSNVACLFTNHSKHLLDWSFLEIHTRLHNDKIDTLQQMPSERAEPIKWLISTAPKSLSFLPEIGKR